MAAENRRNIDLFMEIIRFIHSIAFDKGDTTKKKVK